MNSVSSFIRALLGIGLFFLVLTPAGAAELQVEDAWIKNLPPTVPVRAGYAKIVNTAGDRAIITGFRCAACSAVELHETRMKDGMMSMVRVDVLEIDAGGEALLEPGAMHLMIFPLEATSPGERMTIDFRFADGSIQSIEFTVRK